MLFYNLEPPIIGSMFIHTTGCYNLQNFQNFLTERKKESCQIQFTYGKLPMANCHSRELWILPFLIK